MRATFAFGKPIRPIRKCLCFSAIANLLLLRLHGWRAKARENAQWQSATARGGTDEEAQRTAQRGSCVKNASGRPEVYGSWSFAPLMICRPARRQRSDTAHSFSFEPGRLHASRLTRSLFQKSECGVTASQADANSKAVGMLAKKYRTVLIGYAGKSGLQQINEQRVAAFAGHCPAVPAMPCFSHLFWQVGVINNLVDGDFFVQIPVLNHQVSDLEQPLFRLSAVE